MRIVLASIAAAASIASLPYVSVANNAREIGGLATIHDLRIENGRLCMSDHEHFGQSGVWSSRELAAKRAAQSWAGFTRLEYGAEWADFRVAAAKRIDCSPSGESWTCAVQARPCRR